MRSKLDDVDILDNMGLVFFAGIQLAKKASMAAINSYNSFFAVDNSLRVNYYTEKGIKYTKQGLYKKALPLLESVLTDKPDDQDILFHLGYCYLKLDLYEGAVTLLELASQQGYSANVNSILGMAYMQVEDYQKAVDVLQDAVAKSPDNFNLNYRLGMALDHMKEFEKAIKVFEAALKLRPNETKVCQSIGFAYEQLGKHDQAVIHFKKAAQIQESDQP